MAIRWTPLLAIGVAPIDAQHRTIFAHANRLLEALGEHGTASAASAMLQELAELADAHFAYEEALMRRRGYPRVEEHHAAHAALRCELAGLLGEYDGSAPSRRVIAQTNQFVCDWLLRHVGADDQEFGGWCARQERGRQAATG